ncbi:MAG: hypothetical protein V5A42_00345 [Halofilum sp. (in: g-proteobacteria)]
MRRRGLSAWLSELAHLDRRERSRRLHEGVHTLNRLEIPSRRRLALMEDLRPALREVLEYLASRIQSQALPLPDRARRIHDLNIDLLRECALGYTIIVVSEGPNGRRRRIATAAERALALHGEWMLRTAQIYARVPEAYWHAVNGVYDTAERAGVAYRPVEDSELPRGEARRDSQSPISIYRRILLFGLAGTQGLRRGEAERIYRALADWSDDAHLGIDDGAVSGGTCFAVDLETARGPSPLGEWTVTPEARIRVLEVDSVVDRLEALHRQSPPDDSPLADRNRVGAAALRRLIDSWRPANHERSERAQRGEEVDAEVTLSVIVERLAAEFAPGEEQTRRRHRLDTPGAALTLQTIERPDDQGKQAAEGDAGASWDEVKVGQDRSIGYASARRAEARLDREGTRPEHPRWLLQDVSTTGWRLWWDSEGASRATVGELAALRISSDDGSGHRWSIGVIRRMQFLDDERFEIGVHALSRRGTPARVRREPANPNRKRDRRNEASEPALMLPASQTLDTPATLLVPAHMFRQGEILELELPDRMLRIRLAAIRENTGSFSQYELETAPSRGRGAQEKQGETAGDDPGRAT